jgi:hypothetical protein
MRLILLPLSALASIGAMPPHEKAAAPPDAMMPGYAEPAQKWGSVDEAVAARNCRDRIEQVRDAAGQPALDKTPATAGEGYLINAVDIRVDGCTVMQMKSDVNDLRPLPAPDGPARLQPAR